MLFCETDQFERHENIWANSCDRKTVHIYGLHELCLGLVKFESAYDPCLVNSLFSSLVSFASHHYGSEANGPSPPLSILALSIKI